MEGRVFFGISRTLFKRIYVSRLYYRIVGLLRSKKVGGRVGDLQ